MDEPVNMLSSQEFIALRDAYYPDWWARGVGGRTPESLRPVYRIECHTLREQALALLVKPDNVRAEVHVVPSRLGHFVRTGHPEDVSSLSDEVVMQAVLRQVRRLRYEVRELRQRVRSSLSRMQAKDKGKN